MVSGGSDKTRCFRGQRPRARQRTGGPPHSRGFWPGPAVREDGGREGSRRRRGRAGRAGGQKMDSDPGSLRQRIQAATGQLNATAAALTDEQAREQSLLPGWSRGHVLTHLARNADGLRNLLVWARTGVETSQYPSWDARESGIEAGAGRPAAELATDLRQAAAGFAGEAASMPSAAWQVRVRGFNGPEHPAWYTLFRRLTEVEIHHADLGTGYTPADWPARFVADEMERVVGQFASRDDVPACVLEVTGTGQQIRVGPAAAADVPLRVTGPACWLLAWLIGRDAGTRLSVSPLSGSDQRPPKLPTWM
jgi:maleylpyruvate isomerase